jgi:hypothetical protein
MSDDYLWGMLHSRREAADFQSKISQLEKQLCPECKKKFEEIFVRKVKKQDE